MSINRTYGGCVLVLGAILFGFVGGTFVFGITAESLPAPRSAFGAHAQSALAPQFIGSPSKKRSVFCASLLCLTTLSFRLQRCGGSRGMRNDWNQLIESTQLDAQRDVQHLLLTALLHYAHARAAVLLSIPSGRFPYTCSFAVLRAHDALR